MGFDTRFWGPSAWQLFHLVAFKSPHPQQFLSGIHEILPCKYCRESTTKFVHEHPIRGDPGRWMYDIHNMVNAKLRKQAEDDPTVVNPGPDPSFEEVKARYDKLTASAVPGRDFLFAVSANYPEAPEPADMARQRTFIHHLAEVYPFAKLRNVFQKYLKDHEVALSSRSEYMHWMHGLLSRLSREARTKMPSYRGYAHHVAYYKSGCSKKTYHGKTCRKLAGGGRTKNRDHRKTQRIVHTRLLT